MAPQKKLAAKPASRSGATWPGIQSRRPLLIGPPACTRIPLTGLRGQAPCRVCTARPSRAGKLEPGKFSLHFDWHRLPQSRLSQSCRELLRTGLLAQSQCPILCLRPPLHLARRSALLKRMRQPRPLKFKAPLASPPSPCVKPRFVPQFQPIRQPMHQPKKQALRSRNQMFSPPHCISNAA